MVGAALPVLALLVQLFITGCSPPTLATLPAATSAAPAASESTPPAPRPPAKKRARPIEAIDHVLIISIDGLRPDLALRAYMPRMRALCASGSYTFWAETVAEAYTLPCHTSMLTGVSSDKHGVTWNEYIEEAYPNSPTLFELAKEVGYTTALVSGKMKFVTLLKPAATDSGDGIQRSGLGRRDIRSPQTGDRATDNRSGTTAQKLLFQQPAFQQSNTVDRYYLPPTEPVSDQAVGAEAVRLLHDYRPEVFFVHFPGVDTVGHERGWGTSEQIAAIEQADAAVGQVLDALAELDLAGSTLVILTADHGGAGLDHKTDDALAHFIPWIVSGPGIRRDYDLTLAESPIRIEDTFATACAFLGIELPDACQAKAPLDAMMQTILTSTDP